MREILFTLFTCVLLLQGFEPSLAHKASDSYLRLTVEGDSMHAQWDIALRDLDLALGLDTNDDGQITWGELRSRQAVIEKYALSRLQLKQKTTSCWNHPQQHFVDSHSDGSYAVLFFSVTCPEPISTLEISYNLLFDMDPLHRGLLQINHDGGVQTGVLSPKHQTLQLDLTSNSPWSAFIQYSREGIWHIWIGYDHILFLITLLLPAVVIWRQGRWHHQESLGPALWEVLKIVTAFTLAHSITLSLAVLGIVSLPSRLVESAIAASVLVAALNNVYPIIRTHRWVMTFLFGLIHGLGFASVLIDLGLPGQALALALAGFNIGVEIGQVAIVGVLVPLIFLIRHTWSYQRVVLQYGSVMIGLVAFLWLIERSINIDLQMGFW